jgi:hypothetical protein
MSTFSQAAVTFFAAKRICLTPRAACAKILDVVIVMERYRSGHNEAVLKTVWRKPQGFESLPLRHHEKGRTEVRPFSFQKIRIFFP